MKPRTVGERACPMCACARGPCRQHALMLAEPTKFQQLRGQELAEGGVSSYLRAGPDRRQKRPQKSS